MTSWAHAPGPQHDRRPQLLFVHSPTSGPCRRVESFLAQVLQFRRNHDTFDIVRIDAGERPDLVARFGVEQVPTMLVVEDGSVRARHAGPWGCPQIAELLGPWLRQPGVRAGR